MTVTAEAHAAGPVPKEVLTDLIAKAASILQGMVDRGCAEGFWLETADAVLQAELAAGRNVLLGVGYPSSPEVSIESASFIGRMTGEALLVSVPHTSQFTKPERVLSLAAKAACSSGISLRKLQISDFAALMWRAAGSAELQTGVVRYRTADRCSRSVDGVMKWDQIEGDLVIVDFPPGFNRIREWEPKIFADMLSFQLLEELHGITRVDVSYMVNRFQRELRQTSNFALAGIWPARFVLFPKLSGEKRCPSLAEFSVEIATDRMSYRVTHPGRDPGPPGVVSINDVMGRLSAKGIKLCPLEDMKRIADNLAEGRAFDEVIAAGRPSLPPREPYFELEKIGRNGNVFPKLFTSGSEKIASVAYREAGVYGVDVSGRRVPPGRAGNDGLVSGEGVVRTGDAFFSQKAGSIKFEDNRLEIVAATLVDGSLVAAAGHLHSETSIKVTGGVEQGASLSANGPIEIDGSFSGGYLRCGTGLVVKGGIAGDAASVLLINGSVRIKFMQGGRIRCTGDVVIESNMTGGIIEAGGNVTVLDPAGGIFGGKIVSSGSVTAANIGRRVGKPTEIAFGTDYKKAARQRHLSNRRSKLIGIIESLELYAPEQREKSLKNRRSAEFVQDIKLKMDRLKRVLNSVEQQLQELKLAANPEKSVTAAGTLCSAVRVFSGNSTLTVPEDVAAVRVAITGRSLVIKSLDQTDGKTD
jgi:hypothetical protein